MFASLPVLRESEWSMNIREIRYVITLAETGTLVGAGKKLFVSRQVVGRTVRGIEMRLGHPLFARAKGRHVPTEECLRLAEDGRLLLQAYDSFNATYDPSERPYGIVS